MYLCGIMRDETWAHLPVSVCKFHGQFLSDEDDTPWPASLMMHTVTCICKQYINPSTIMHAMDYDCCWKGVLYVMTIKNLICFCGCPVCACLSPGDPTYQGCSKCGGDRSISGNG